VITLIVPVPEPSGAPNAIPRWECNSKLSVAVKTPRSSKWPGVGVFGAVPNARSAAMRSSPC